MNDREDTTPVRRAWDARALRAPHAQPDKAARVQAMFDAIAPTYERVNTVGSLGRDATWRRRAVAAAEPGVGDVVLDIGCGTGDMLRAFAAAQPALRRVIGVDFSAEMLRHARLDAPDGAGDDDRPSPFPLRHPKRVFTVVRHGRGRLLPSRGLPGGSPSPLAGHDPERPCGGECCWGAEAEDGGSAFPVPCSLLRADALRLPLADATVDIISCAFAVRNLADVQAGLAEMARVARPGARVVILEFATPESLVLRWLYQFYCDVILPRIGAFISRDRTGAYRYLPRSIQTFEPVATMVRRLQDVGFVAVTATRMNLGGVVLYRGERR